MRREEHHPLKSLIHKELLCLPATYQLGKGADGVQKATDVEPQRRDQLSALFAPNYFPSLCHTVKKKKKIVLEANPAEQGKKVDLLSADP